MEDNRYLSDLIAKKNSVTNLGHVTDLNPRCKEQYYYCYDYCGHKKCSKLLLIY